MNYIGDHISTIINFLNENTEYAVLRNFDGLPDKNNARDIDIILKKSEFKRIKQDLVKLIHNSGWKILTYLNSDRLITYVCARIVGVDMYTIQWDFFFDTSVFGIRLISADEFLKSRQFNGFLYHPDINCQFLDKYLYDRAVGAKYPDKYQATRERAEYSKEVTDKIKSIFGCTSVTECDKTSSKKLLLHAIGWNLCHRPLSFIGGLILFVYTFVGNYVKSDTGFSIGFTGPDGSGKTTVIDLMIEKLGDVFRTAHAYYHFRPALFGNLGDVAHSAGMKKEVDKNYSDPHRGSKTGIVSSIARLCYYSVDYIIGYFVKVKSKIRITRIVIFDRYFTDIICDSRRSRIYLNYKMLYWWGKLFIPSLDYNILLTADTQTILARKNELDVKGIEDINRKIDYLSNKKGYYRIINDGTPDEAVIKILSIVLNAQNSLNLKRQKITL